MVIIVCNQTHPKAAQFPIAYRKEPIRQEKKEDVDQWGNGKVVLIAKWEFLDLFFVSNITKSTTNQSSTRFWPCLLLWLLVTAPNVKPSPLKGFRGILAPRPLALRLAILHPALNAPVRRPPSKNPRRRSRRKKQAPRPLTLWLKLLKVLNYL